MNKKSVTFRIMILVAIAEESPLYCFKGGVVVFVRYGVVAAPDSGRYYSSVTQP
jgi:hypothetical protein